ncbi:MAG: FHA domain-containing protein, partial [Pyrinomonadaceae bacterium]
MSMLEVTLTYPTPEGSEEIPLDDSSVSLGRGSDADLRFDDDGLSRLHATIHREGDRIWVLDENSTNGTTVNGVPVPPQGAPLHNGDAIKIGHYTNIRIFISERRETPASISYNQAANPISVSANSTNNFHLLPIALTIGALLVIGISAVIIGVKVLGKSEPAIVQNNDSSDDFNDETEPKKTSSPKKTESAKTESSPTPAPSPAPDKSPNAIETSGSTPAPLSTGKKYQQMSDAEKNQYIQVKAEKVARIIGNQTGEPIPPEAVAKIRGFLEGYASRLNHAPVDDCTGRGWLRSDMNSALKRASRNAPVIIPAFNEQ